MQEKPKVVSAESTRKIYIEWIKKIEPSRKKLLPKQTIGLLNVEYSPYECGIRGRHFPDNIYREPNNHTN